MIVRIICPLPPQSLSPIPYPLPALPLILHLLSRHFTILQVIFSAISAFQNSSGYTTIHPPPYLSSCIWKIVFFHAEVGVRFLRSDNRHFPTERYTIRTRSSRDKFLVDVKNSSVIIFIIIGFGSFFDNTLCQALIPFPTPIWKLMIADEVENNLLNTSNRNY